MIQVVNEIEVYRLDILGLSRVRCFWLYRERQHWTGTLKGLESKNDSAIVLLPFLQSDYVVHNYTKKKQKARIINVIINRLCDCHMQKHFTRVCSHLSKPVTFPQLCPKEGKLVLGAAIVIMQFCHWSSYCRCPTDLCHNTSLLWCLFEYPWLHHAMLFWVAFSFCLWYLIIITLGKLPFWIPNTWPYQADCRFSVLCTVFCWITYISIILIFPFFHLLDILHDRFRTSISTLTIFRLSAAVVLQTSDQ